MGKKQHSKDRMYITKTEWATEWGGFKAKKEIRFRSLPFYCCGISFTPFDDPVCTDDGTVFDITNIVPYVQKFGKHPVTGEPLKLSQLHQLNFHKNSDGEYHCPVMNKVFTPSTHIVAIKTTGNVYCYEAVEELNIKPKNWKDLLTDEKFVRKDIITIQDPLKLEGKQLDSFDHVKRNLQVIDAEEQARRNADPANNVKVGNDDVKRALGALASKEEQAKASAGGGGHKAQLARLLAAAKSSDASNSAPSLSRTVPNDPRLRAPERNDGDVAFRPGASTWNTDDCREGDPLLASKKKKSAVEKNQGAAVDANAGKPSPHEVYKQTAGKWVEGKSTTGAASRGFTSTTWEPIKKNDRERVLVKRNPKKKGYVRMHTSLGDLNIELHCDIVPRTCENFLELCHQGYYDNTTFHRSIRSFMVQGGDPTGTGKGGESIYGPTFQDELDSRLTHSGRGVLSMANSGQHTNGSQFFILYKSAHHLDFKHAVFGKVVGGMEILSAMEQIDTDEDDRPKKSISFLSATVFVNPFREMAAEESQKAEEDRQMAEKEANGPDKSEFGSWYSNPAGNRERAGTDGGDVGKYLKQTKFRKADDKPSETRPAKSSKTSGYGNFDAW